MVPVDRSASLQFLNTAYEPDDWIAVFLKAYDTGRVTQRIGPLAMFREARWQSWLAAMHDHRFNVYVAVNALAPHSRRRTRESIDAIRHVFIEADREGPRLLATVHARRDLPPPSYVLHSSPNRLHVLWRVKGFSPARVERLQKQLARELGTDPAATPSTQTTRLAGFWNLKYRAPHLVTVDYRNVDRLYTPDDFPKPAVPVSVTTRCRHDVAHIASASPAALERARRYLASVPAAIAGQHGDLHTFRMCCRLVRGFALSDREALGILADWNARCVPPWTERELIEKLRRARKYGREPFGQLLTRNG